MREHEALLRVNPEQTPGFMLGSLRVDFSIKNIINEIRKAR